MGLGGIHIWHLLILFLIVLVLFGTNKLRNIGADLGAAVKGFRNAMKDGETESGSHSETEPGRIINAQAHREESSQQSPLKDSNKV